MARKTDQISFIKNFRVCKQNLIHQVQYLLNKRVSNCNFPIKTFLLAHRVHLIHKVFKLTNMNQDSYQSIWIHQVYLRVQIISKLRSWRERVMEEALFLLLINHQFMGQQCKKERNKFLILRLTRLEFQTLKYLTGIKVKSWDRYLATSKCSHRK